MTEKPILFSTPMIHALLAGTKTQTRRIAKCDGNPFHSASGAWLAMNAKKGAITEMRCPYGEVGGRLWVREGFRIEQRGNRATGEKFDVYVYRADSRMRLEFDPLRYKPSIHMPRAASRITLKITDIRVEPLTEISTADCWAEGIPHSPDIDPRHEYHDLWQDLNFERAPWDSNPWVWVVCFSAIKEKDHG